MPAQQIGSISRIDLGGAEIAVSSAEHAVALVTGGDNVLRLVSLADIANPNLVVSFSLDANAQSVAVTGDLVAVAKVNSTDKAQPGSVEFFRLSGVGAEATLTSLGVVQVGSLPDSVSFNAASTKLVVANEGEAIDSSTTDAVGSISIVDVSSFSSATIDVSSFGVTNLGFEAYNNQKVKLELLGIRLSEGTPSATAAQDFEPEAIGIIGDRAYVTLQENNAIAEVDLATGKITDLWSLGIKDWSRGTPVATNYSFELPYIGTRPDFNGNGTTEPGEVTAGGLSGLWYQGKEGANEIYFTISDRGPQAASIGDRTNDNPGDPNKGEKIFDDPDFAPTIYRLAKTAAGVVTVVGATSLKVPDGNGGFRPATGVGELPSKDDNAFALKTAGNGIAADSNQYNVYEQVGWDAFGLDTESVNHFSLSNLNGGNPVFAVSDEYRPQVALFDAATGNLIQRFVASNTVYDAGDYTAGRGDVAGFTTFLLPAIYGDRQANRGFEGMAFNSSDGLLYAFMQSPLRPTSYKNKEFIRILAINPVTGQPVHEYLSLLPIEAGQDKIGDAVYDAARNVFVIIERDSELGSTANKSVTEINLNGATDTLDYTLAQNGKSWAAVLAGKTQPELVDTNSTAFGSIADVLADIGVQMAHREELFNLPSVLGADPAFDKVEGLALKPDGSLVFAFDNDFIKVAGRTDNILTEVTFTPTPIDTNDKDGKTDDIAIRKLYGLTMADGLDAFSQGGKAFIIVAGEGDDRAGDLPNSISTPDKTRSGSLNGADTANLGSRLNLVNTEGNYDGGALDQAYGFGSRSFRIYDQNQNLIFDSGNQLEELAKQLGVYDEGRSDDKGTEPEMVATHVINGRRYAFIGLERGTTSTVVVFDITNPYQPVYTTALRSQDAISPEGVKFIATEDSGAGYLMAANEISGTLEFFRFGDVRSAADQNQFNGGTQPEMMLPVAGTGYRADALYTIGSGDAGMITGVPDGQGAYRLNNNTIRILVNSEIGNTKGYSYLLASGAELLGARINYIDVNNAGQVVGGGLAHDTIYDRTGALVTNESQVRGPGITAGGFSRFCSANLVEANTFGPGKGAADRLFLVGEESGGTMWILNTEKGELWAAPDLGYGGWEAATMVDTGSTNTVAYFMGDDGPAAEGAPLYLYVGTKKADGNTLERNGLVGGQLYYWKSNSAVINEDGLAEGATNSGVWVAINAQDKSNAGQSGYDAQGYKLATTLRNEVFAGGGFMGYRVEDVDYNPNNPNQIAFNTTGGGSNARAGDDKFGSVWTLDLAFNAGGTAPVSAVLKHLYDGDAADNQQLGVRSPDNLAWSKDGNIYVMEDKSTTFEGSEASIFKLNATTGDAERILVMNRGAALPAGQTDKEAASLGAWESSGIVDVSELYGNTPGTDFFFAVQAHGVTGGAIDAQNLVEGGQIMAASAPAPQREAMMKPVAYGYDVEVLYTIGDSVAGFTATGVPDGQGAYRLNNNTIRILVNSEIGNTKGYSYLLASGAELLGARINYIDVNNAGQVVGGGLAHDTIYDRTGALVTNESQVRGPGITAGGFSRFCSANLVEANTFGPGKGAADRLFLVGEESGGTMWILNTEKGELWAAPDLGYGGWEAATMVDTGSTNTVAYFMGDDGPAAEGAPLYLYVGTKKADGNTLERNGLVGGQLYYWKSNSAVINEDGLAEGATNSGVWVAINAQDKSNAGQSGYDAQGYKLATTLRNEVFAGGGFMGYRVEDVDYNPNNPNQIAFNTTGGGSNARAGDDKFGSVWTLDLAFNAGGTAPVSAVLKHLYDGDAADNQQLGVRSPDNLAWSKDGNIYVMEDKSTTFEGSEASIFKLNATTGDAERILVMNRGAALPAGQTDKEAASLGAWESSGIVDVSELYGNTPGTDFFFAVQAHGVTGGAIDAQNLVEGGQILKVSRDAYGNELQFLNNTGLQESQWTRSETNVKIGRRSQFEAVTLLGELNSTAIGNQNGNVLVGNFGNNRLQGMKGEDALWGLHGNDKLIGNRGADQFIFAAREADELFDVAAAQGQDLIVDFRRSQGDKIALDRSAFGLASELGDGFSVPSDFAVVSRLAQASSSEASIVYVNRSRELVFNANGAADGVGEGGGAFAKLLSGASSSNPLTTDDFVII